MCIKSIATYTNYVYAIHPTPKGVGFPLNYCNVVLEELRLFNLGLFRSTATIQSHCLKAVGS